MQLLLSLVLLLGLLSLPSEGQQALNRKKPGSTRGKFRCNATEFEVHFNQMMVMGSNRRFPENNKELDSFCKESNELHTKIDRYKKHCMRETMRNLASILLYSIRGQTKQVCTRRDSLRTKTLVAASHCINRNSAKVGKCLDRMSESFRGIKLVKDHLKMPHICCEYVRLMECFMVTMQTSGCEQQLPILVDQIRNVMGNFVDSSCGDYTAENDKCNHLGPPPKAPKDNKSGSFLKNLVDIFETINQ